MYYCKSCTPWDRKNWGKVKSPEYYNVQINDEVLIEDVTPSEKKWLENKLANNNSHKYYYNPKPMIKLEHWDDNFLTKTVFYERIPKGILIALLNSKKIPVEKYLPNDLYFKKGKDLKITDTIDHIKKFCDRIINDIVEVRYSKEDINDWGRVYPVNLISANAIPGIVKRSLMKDLYYEFDLNACYPSIVKNVCDTYNIPCPVTKEYLENKDEINKLFIDKFKFKGDDALELSKKIIYTSFWNGDKADVDKMYEEMKLDKKIQLPDFFWKLRNEMIKIKNILKEKNPELYLFAKRNYPNLVGKRFRKSDSHCFGRNSVDGYFLSLFLQEQELRIVNSITEWLYFNTNTMRYDGQNGFMQYEYDSIRLLKDSVDNEFGSGQRLAYFLRDLTYKLTGFSMKWNEKSMYKEYIDIKDEMEKLYKMDPGLYNVLNGCWLCNFDKQNLENDYLMDRSFFNGVEGPPCNRPFIMIPKNSKDL